MEKALTRAPADGSLIQAPIKPEAADALNPESAGLRPPPATAEDGADGGAPRPKRPRRDPDAVADPDPVAVAEPGTDADAEEKTWAHAHRDGKISADAQAPEAEAEAEGLNHEAEGVE